MGTIWELDFYSRPILDENEKKLWEVLVCESPLNTNSSPKSLFRFSKFCRGTEVNSVTLKTAIEEAIAQAPSPPEKIRFFRRQMTNMITKACIEAGLDAQPSRRTYALHQWLKQRHQEFYPNYPGYQPSINPSVTFAETNPQPLPDALIGQQWAFVTLQASAFAEMNEWTIDFSEAFPLKMMELAPDALIPGVIIFSSRAMPLAGWMSGLEMAFLRFVSGPPAQLLLETGANNCWILANLSTPQLQAEAQEFEAAKQKAQQVHFLAVQSSSQSETFAGFWLLQELNLA